MKKLLLAATLFAAIPFVTFADSPFTGDISSKTTKIVGGVKSPLGAWPSTVALLSTRVVNGILSGSLVDPSTGQTIPAAQANYYAQGCGASLVAPNWVLTAAHCVVDQTTGLTIKPSAMTALVGTSDLMSGGRRIPIKRIVVHPSYSNVSTDSDIALLELTSSTTVKTIGFANTDIPTGTLATIVGWGALDTAATLYPSRLYEVNVPIVNRVTCEAVYNTPGAIAFTGNMICAGYAQGGKDTCQADSGGPLMAVYKGKLVQAGITSWGVGCAQPGFYGVYTRINKFRGWINSKIKSTTPSGASGGGSLFYLLLPFLLLLIMRQLSWFKGIKV